MNRHSSNLSKTYRIWHLKWLRVFLDNEAQLLLVHHLQKKGRWTSKKHIMEFASNMARLAIWARYCSSALWLYVVETGHAGPTKKVTADARWTLLQDSCFMDKAARQPDSLQDTEKSFLLCWGVWTHTMAYGLKMEHYRRTSGDWPGNVLSLSFLEFIYYPPVVFEGVEDR